eukprot:gene28301-50132_t
MEFRRITNLPPYVFTIINNLKIEARRAGVDVIDLGFGNPDIPSPQIAVDKLAEAAHIERNHRYSLSRGLPKLREAVAALPGSPLLTPALVLLVLGFGLKMGLVPLHVWMPLAHPVAPMPASAALSGIIVKAGVIGATAQQYPLKMAAMGVALFLFCFFTTTERVTHVVERQSLWVQTKLLLRNDQWLILCGVCVTGTIGYVLRGSV